jgi:hypothetical protein
MYRRTRFIRASERAHKLGQPARDRYSFVSNILPVTTAESGFCEPVPDEFAVKSNVFIILPVALKKFVLSQCLHRWTLSAFI